MTPVGHVRSCDHTDDENTSTSEETDNNIVVVDDMRVSEELIVSFF